jgi:hypothetical protein
MDDPGNVNRVCNGLDVQQPRTQGSLCAGPGTRLDVQQDVVSVTKQN